MEKPEFAKSEHFEYLLQLRDSAAINMMGAVPYLVRDFGLTKYQAKDILFYWMKNPEEK